jgi:hypothetical protein
MWIWGLQPRALAVIEIWTTARNDVVSVQTRRKVLGSARTGLPAGGGALLFLASRGRKLKYNTTTALALNGG